MPFPSLRSSTTRIIKKKPTNYEIPNTQNIPNLTANSDDGKFKQPKVEGATSSSSFMSFNFSRDSAQTTITDAVNCVNSTDEQKMIREIPCFGKKINKDFEVGEPSRFQRLTIDFTPIKGVDDDEELQQKCIDFWEFVNSEPRLKKIMAEPVKRKDGEMDNIENINNQNILKPKTALQWATSSPMLNYLGKLSYKYCPEPSASYKQNSSKSNSESSASTLKLSNTSMWRMKHKKGTQPKDVTTSATPRSTRKDDTKKVCADMDEFDRKHPRSFEPPARNPTLITAKMQRPLPSLL